MMAGAWNRPPAWNLGILRCGHAPAKGRMKILYALAVLSFFALVWAAISITRHIRRSVPTKSSAEAPILLHPARPGKVSPPGSSSRQAKDPLPSRDPVATRSQADWVALQKSIGNHDLGNLDYPSAAGGTRLPRPSSKPSA